MISRILTRSFPLFLPRSLCSTLNPAAITAKCKQQLQVLDQLMEQSANINGKGYLQVKDRVEGVLGDILAELKSFNHQEIIQLAQALKKRTRSFRIRRDLIVRMEENTEKRFVELLPGMTTDQILDVFNEIYNFKKHFKRFKQLFAHLKNLNMSIDQLMRLLEVTAFREIIDSAAYKGLYKLLQQTPNLPPTPHFLHMVGRLQFQQNLPYFTIPICILNLLPQAHSRIPSLTSSQKCYLLKSYRYMYDSMPPKFIPELYQVIRQNHYQKASITDMKDLYESLRYLWQMGEPINMGEFYDATIRKLFQSDKYETDFFWRTVSIFIENQLVNTEEEEQRFKKVRIRVMQLLLEKLMKVGNRIREKIKPLEFLVHIHPNPAELKEIVMELEKGAESPVECTRMSFVHQMVCPEVPYPHQERLNKFSKENVILVLESMNRAFNRKKSIEQSKKLLQKCRSFLNLSNQPQANVYANALLSTYQIQQFRKYWWQQMDLLRTLQTSSFFVLGIFKQLSSDRHTFRDTHLRLIIDIYKNANSNNHLIIVKNFAPFLKMNKVLGPIKNLDRWYLLNSFLRTYIKDRIIYSDVENAYTLLRILESLRRECECNTEYLNLLARAFTEIYRNLGVDPYVLNYFLRHMDTLIERRDIPKESIEMFYEFIKNKKDSNMTVTKLQLLNRLIHEPTAKQLHTKLKQQILDTAQHRHLHLLFRDPTPSDTLTPTHCLQLTRPATGIPPKSLQFAITSLNIDEISKRNFLKVVRNTLSVRKTSPSIIWIVSGLEKFEGALNDDELNLVVTCLARERVLLPEVMQKLARTTENLGFINNCYQLGYYDQGFEGYLQRNMGTFVDKVKTFTLSDQLRTVQNLICYILSKPKHLESKTDAQVLRICLQRILKKKVLPSSDDPNKPPASLPVDIRFGVCLDLLRLNFQQQLSQSISSFREFIGEHPPGSFLQQYNKLSRKSLPTASISYLQKHSFHQQTQSVRDSSSVHIPLHFRRKAKKPSTLIVLPREYQIRGSANSGIGDFNLIKKHVLAVYAKKEAVGEWVVVSAQEVAEGKRDLSK